MKNASDSISRKDVLRTLAAIPAAGAAFVAGTSHADAAATISQKAAAYQNTPKQGKDCDDCRFFIAGGSKSVLGNCQLVVGKISPKGWCKFIQPK
ncbi:MAG: high-potential iron-sulfur protein [Vulcanimicrobiaceae bacterium]